MADLTVAEMEAYMRERWKDIKVWVRDLDSYGTDQFNIEINSSTTLSRRWQEDDTREGINKCWQAAYDFTRQREEAIRLMDEEISCLCLGDHEMPHEVRNRIIAREQEALADLQRGWRMK
jgi:hypothetical protein